MSTQPEPTPQQSQPESLTRPFWYLEPANNVALTVNSQGPDGLAFVAIPPRPATEPYEQYGVVLPRDVARTLALRMLATLEEER